MSRTRTSLTPFNIEPHAEFLRAFRMGVQECTHRKEKDTDEMWKIAQEVVNGYDCTEDRSAERKRQLLEQFATILDNTEKYRELRREQRQALAVIQSLEGGSVGVPTAQSVSWVTENCNTSVQTSSTAEASHEDLVADEHRPHQPSDLVNNDSAEGNSEAQKALCDDMMPLPAADNTRRANIKKIGVKSRAELEEIDKTRDREISIDQYHQFFSDRPIFKYQRHYCIARCPIHQDLIMDLDKAKLHYYSCHLAKPQKRLHLDTMRFFGIKIIATDEELQRLLEAANDKSQWGSEPSDIATQVDLGPSAVHGLTAATEQLTNGSKDVMQIEESGMRSAHERQSAEIEVASSTSLPSLREISRRISLDEEDERINIHDVSEPDTWSRGSSVSESRPFIRKKYVNDRNRRTSASGHMGCESRYGTSNEPASVNPQAPRRHIVTLGILGSPNTVRRKLAATGLKMSPAPLTTTSPTTVSVTAAAAVDAQTDAATRHKPLGPPAGADTEPMDLDPDNVQRVGDCVGSRMRAGAGGPAITPREAWPSPWRRAPMESLKYSSTVAVEEPAGTANRIFTPSVCPKCGDSFDPPAFLYDHVRSCTRQPVGD